MPNLERHIQNALKYGVNVVVAVNSFAADTPAEVELIRKAALEFGAMDAVVATHWADGGAGAVKLAEAVIKAAQKPNDFKFLYPLELSIKEKIETIAREIYRADGVDYSPEAEEQIARYNRLGFDKLPICMAKTHLSFTTDVQPQGRAHGLPHPGPRDPRLGRCRLPLSAARQDEHHAGPAHAACLLRRGPGPRNRKSRRVVLARRRYRYKTSALAFRRGLMFYCAYAWLKGSAPGMPQATH